MVSVAFLFALPGMVVPAHSQSIPQYEVDPFWPKLPIADGWITGGLGGMCIDSRDHVYVLNRQNVVEADLNAATLAAPVIEFDPAGNVVRAWGDPEVIGDRLPRGDLGRGRKTHNSGKHVLGQISLTVLMDFQESSHAIALQVTNTT